MGCSPMPLTRSLLCLLAPAALVLAACDAPVVGTWQSDVSLTPAPPWGTRNRMVVDSDLAGEAKIYAAPASDHTAWTSFKFEFTGEEYDDGITWRFAMSCVSGPCSNDDFKMKCQVVDEGNDGPIKMECEGNNRWAAYAFDWEEVDE